MANITDLNNPDGTATNDNTTMNDIMGTGGNNNPKEDVYAPVDEVINKVKQEKFASSEEYAKAIITELLDLALPSTEEEKYKGTMFSSPTKSQKVKKIMEG